MAAQTRPGRRLSAPVSLLVTVPLVGLVFGVLPVAIAMLATRHGLSDHRPDGWNLLGLVPLLAGLILFVWADAGHYRAIPPEGATISWWTTYLLGNGPYAHTRNPLYVAEATMWLGWVVLFGSVALLVGLVVIVAGQNVIVRLEEARLEADFGDAYRAYKTQVPRWLRLSRR
jgi:protein-S-isoprenylcysteine O-methyltransferase Ste14